MAALVGIAAFLRVSLAPHVAFGFMDRRCLRSPHDVEGNRLVRVAAEAADCKIAVSGIECVAQCRRWLRRTLEAEHALVPRIRRACRLPCVLPPPVQLPRGRMR